MRPKSLAAMVLAIGLGLGFYAVIWGYGQWHRFQTNCDQFLSDLTGKTVTLDELGMTWEGGKLFLTATAVKVLEPATMQPLFSAQRIDAAIGIWASLRARLPVFKRLILDGPRFGLAWAEHKLHLHGLARPTTTGDWGRALKRSLYQLEALQISDLNLAWYPEPNKAIIVVGLHGEISPATDAETYNFALTGRMQAQPGSQLAIQGSFEGPFQQQDQGHLDAELTLEKIALAQLLPKLSGIAVQGQVATAKARLRYTGSLQEAALSFAIPSLRIDSTLELVDLAGQLRYLPTADAWQLDCKQLNLVLPQLYPSPKQFVDVTATAKMPNPKANQPWQAHIQALEAGHRIPVQGSLSLAPQTHKLQRLSFEFSEVKVQQALAWIPQHISSTAHQWLTHNIRTGDATGLVWQWQDDTWALSSQIRHLNVLPAVDWPEVSIAKARLRIDPTILTLTCDAGRIQALDFTQANLTLPLANLPAEAPLTITGKIAADAPRVTDFLQVTPYRKLGQTLSRQALSGHLAMQLQLNFNLTQEPVAFSSAGQIQCLDVSAKLPGLSQPLSQLNGRIEFGPGLLAAHQLQGQIHDQRISPGLSVGTQGQWQAKLSLKLSDKLLDKATYPWLGVMQGSTDVQLLFAVAGQAPTFSYQLQLDSSLRGMAVQCPPPLTKFAAERLPMQLSWHDNATGQPQLELEIKRWVAAKFTFAEEALARGHWVFGGERPNQWLAQTGMVVEGAVAECDAWAWQQLARQLGESSQVPLKLDLQVADFRADTLGLGQVHIKYSSATNKLRLDGQQVVGSIKLPTAPDNLIVAQFSRIHLPGSKLAQLKSSHFGDNLPMVDFHSHDIQWGDYRLGEVAFQLLPRNYGYDINSLKIQQGAWQVDARGQWQFQKGLATQLSGQLHSKNIRHFEESLNLPATFDQGAATLAFQFKAPSHPWYVSVEKLDGRVEVQVQEGIIKGVDPGLGRIISLLSLENIQRRLKLDFSDFTKQGLYFDKLSALVKCRRGWISTDNMEINGPSAEIALRGKTRFADKTLAGDMIVVPNVGTTVPVAAAIAVNPAVGAALWLFDKASGAKLSKLTYYKYKISGTWDKPELKEIARTADKKVGTKRTTDPHDPKAKQGRRSK